MYYPYDLNPSPFPRGVYKYFSQSLVIVKIIARYCVQPQGKEKKRFFPFHDSEVSRGKNVREFFHSCRCLPGPRQNFQDFA